MPRRKHPKVRLKLEDRTHPETGHPYAILRWTDPTDAKRKSRALGYLPPATAEEARVDLEAALRLKVALPTDSSVERVRDVLIAYLEDLEQRAVSKAHVDQEVHHCTTITRHLGRVVANQVNAGTLSRYQGTRKREPTRLGQPPSRHTIHAELVTLRRAFRCATEQGLIACGPPPMPSGKLPDDSRPPRRLTSEEVGQLIVGAHASRTPGFGWLVQTLAWSGRRPIAVLGLHVADVSRLLDEGLAREQRFAYWRTDKGGVGRGWGPVTAPALEALVGRAEEVGEGKLFPQRKSAQLWRPFQAAAARVGVDNVQPYDLRRFACTQILAQLGGEVRDAMLYTGHRRPETLMKYTYHRQGVAEAMAARIGWAPVPLRLVEQDGD